MGYSYGLNARGNMVLACDNCGDLGGVRKRRCPHKVLTDSLRGPRHWIDYCPAPAVCPTCWSKPDVRARAHGDCAEGARQSQARDDEIERRLDAGESGVIVAYGDWHPEVPAGMVGVGFNGRAGERYMLVPKADYDPSVRRWLSDYPGAVPWDTTMAGRSKRVG